MGRHVPARPDGVNVARGLMIALIPCIPFWVAVGFVVFHLYVNGRV